MKSIRNVDVLYTIHEKSRVLEECICRVESACDTGHFESVDSALRTKPELRAALGAYIRQMLALIIDTDLHAAGGKIVAQLRMIAAIDKHQPPGVQRQRQRITLFSTERGSLIGDKATVK